MNDYERTRVMCAEVRSLEYSAMIQPSQVLASFDPVAFCREHGLTKYYSPIAKANISVETEPKS